MSEFTSSADIAYLRNEIAALKRENEILHKWLEDQRSRVNELTNLLIGIKNNG